MHFFSFINFFLQVWIRIPNVDPDPGGKLNVYPSTLHNPGRNTYMSVVLVSYLGCNQLFCGILVPA